MLLITGYPSALVNFITHEYETNFVNIEEEKVKELIKHNSTFQEFTLLLDVLQE